MLYLYCLAIVYPQFTHGHDQTGVLAPALLGRGREKEEVALVPNQGAPVPCNPVVRPVSLSSPSTQGCLGESPAAAFQKPPPGTSRAELTPASRSPCQLHLELTAPLSSAKDEATEIPSWCPIIGIAWGADICPAAQDLLSAILVSPKAPYEMLTDGLVSVCLRHHLEHHSSGDTLQMLTVATTPLSIFYILSDSACRTQTHPPKGVMVLDSLPPPQLPVLITVDPLAASV